MTATAQHVPTAPENPDRSRRRRIALAVGSGGLVLGIGAVVTMAAWTSTERSQADFEAGRFSIQGSADGSTFSENPGSPGLEISFDALAAKLSPGATTYAPYAVQLTAGSDYAADVTLTSSTGTGTAADALTYTIVQTPTFGCTADTTGTTLVSDQSASGTPGAEMFSLDAAGDTVYLCLQVTAGDDLAQGSTGNIEWNLTGASTAPLS
ncbi:MAG TPA: SipW-dependent-type signal peptide-containing protein [Cellulomonas sp.]